MAATQSQEEFEFKPIPLELLLVPESNVRQREVRADVSELAESMRSIGLQQPIVVQPRGDRFEILVGQRRFLAAKEIAAPYLWAKVYKLPVTELTAKLISLSENMQRRDLAPGDKADALQYLLDELGSIRVVAERVGVTEQTVRKWLDFRAVPESLRAMANEKKISPRQATRLWQYVRDPVKVAAIAAKMAELGPREERERILAAAVETPGRSVETILQRANDMKRRKTIQFILPANYSVAIESAASDLAKDPNEIALDATMEWLDSRRYTPSSSE